MKVLKGTPAQLEAFIQTLEQMAWDIFPTIGRTVIEEEGVKYLVNLHRGSDHTTKTLLRYAEAINDAVQDIDYIPFPTMAGCAQEYLDLVQGEIDASDLIEDDAFQPTVNLEEETDG